MWGKVALIIRKKLAAVTQGGQRENMCGSQATPWGIAWHFLALFLWQMVVAVATSREGRIIQGLSCE